MQSVEVEVRNPSGLHARPAALFVKTAARFRSRITVENLSRDGRTGDAKSAIAMLGAAVSRGNRIRINADGEDEADAVAALRDLVDSGIGEAID